MTNWKLNRRYFLLRLLTFPIKLVFTIFWNSLFALMQSLRWLVCGSTETLFSGPEDRDNITGLIHRAEKLIEILEKQF
jgi:hypothetical protein